MDDESPSPLLFTQDGAFVDPGPLYHNGPIVWSCGALLSGNHVVVLPRFDDGTEVEYYFVVLQNRQVIAKSPVIYKTRTTQTCQTTFERHSVNLLMECLPPTQNPIATAMNASFHTGSTTADKPSKQSPEKPDKDKDKDGGH